MKLDVGDKIQVSAVFAHYRQGEDVVIKTTKTVAYGKNFNFSYQREFDVSDCGRYGRIVIKGNPKLYSARYFFEKETLKKDSKEFVLPKEFID